MNLNWKNITISAIVCGVVLLVVTFAADFIAGLIAPYSIMDLSGMRSFDDPIMALYFLYPFVLALTAGIVFDIVKDSIKGESSCHRGVVFGTILFLLLVIPEFILLYSSMDYPTGFYISAVLSGIIGYPLMGIAYVKIWEKLG